MDAVNSAWGNKNILSSEQGVTMTNSLAVAPANILDQNPTHQTMPPMLPQPDHQHGFQSIQQLQSMMAMLNPNQGGVPIV